jgi:hypothetical protein
MPFIGNQPALSYTSFAKQDFTTSATTSYTLDNSVANENEIALFINFVRQEPTTAYSASGTTLTLTSATSASDDMYCVFLGKAVQTVNPPSGSVGISQLSATGTKDATTFLRGDNTFASAGGANTPSFFAYLSANQSIPNITTTKIQIDTETFDTDNAYDNSTNYRFTPAVAGKYLIFGQVMMDGMPDQTEIITYIYKNDTNYAFSRMKCSGAGTNSNMIQILDTANTTDYYDIRMYQSGGSSKNAQGSNTFRTFFGANKIIE